MWFFVQVCSSWQDFNCRSALRGSSAVAELIIIIIIIIFSTLGTYDPEGGLKNYWKNTKIGTKNQSVQS